MQLDIRTLYQYRLDRAKEDLLAAKTNHQAGLYKAAIDIAKSKGYNKFRRADRAKFSGGEDKCCLMI